MNRPEETTNAPAKSLKNLNPLGDIKAEVVSRANLSSRWIQSIVMATKAYVVASVVAALAILVITGDLETMAAGLLAPLFLLPSMGLFIAFAQMAPARRWEHAGYLVPALGILLYLMVLVVMDIAGQIREGSGLPAIMAFTFSVPAVVTYWLLLRMDRKIA